MILIIKILELLLIEILLSLDLKDNNKTYFKLLKWNIYFIKSLNQLKVYNLYLLLNLIENELFMIMIKIYLSTNLIKDIYLVLSVEYSKMKMLCILLKHYILNLSLIIGHI